MNMPLKLRFYFCLSILLALIPSLGISETTLFTKQGDLITFSGALAEESNPNRADLRVSFTEVVTGKKWVIRPAFTKPNLLKVRSRDYFPDGSYNIALVQNSDRKEILSFSAYVSKESAIPAMAQILSVTRGEEISVGPISPELTDRTRLSVQLNGASTPFNLNESGAVVFTVPPTQKLASKAKLEVFYQLRPDLNLILHQSSFAVEDSRTPYIVVEHPVAADQPGLVQIVVPKFPEVKDMVESKLELHIRPGEKLPEKVQVFSDGKLTHIMKRDPKTGKRQIRDVNSGKGFDITPKPELGIADVELVTTDAAGKEINEPFFEATLKEIEPELSNTPAPPLTPVAPAPRDVTPKLELTVKDCLGNEVKGDPMTSVAYEIQRLNSESTVANLFHDSFEVPLRYNQEKGVYQADFPTLYNTEVDLVGLVPAAAVVRSNLGNLEMATEFACDWGGLISAIGNVEKVKKSVKVAEEIDGYLSKYMSNETIDKTYAGALRGAVYAAQNETEHAKREVLFGLIHELFGKLASVSGESVDKTVASYMEDTGFVIAEEAECQRNPNPANCMIRPYSKFLRGAKDVAISGFLRDPVGVVCAPLKFKYDLNDKDSGFWGSMKSIMSPSQFEFNKFTIRPVVYRQGDRVTRSKLVELQPREFSYPLKISETGRSDHWHHTEVFNLENSDTACPRLFVQKVNSESNNWGGVAVKFKPAMPMTFGNGISEGGFMVGQGNGGRLPDFVGTKKMSIITSYKSNSPGQEIEASIRSYALDGKDYEEDIAILTDKYPVMNCDLSRDSRDSLVEISCSEARGLYIEFNWSLDNGWDQSTPPFTLRSGFYWTSHYDAFAELGSTSNYVQDLEASLFGRWFTRIPEGKDKVRLCVTPNYMGPAADLELEVNVYRDGELIFNQEHTLRPGDNMDCSKGGAWLLDLPTGGSPDWAQ